eukprot:7007094-Prymnesium_polylepis.1
MQRKSIGAMEEGLIRSRCSRVPANQASANQISNMVTPLGRWDITTILQASHRCCRSVCDGQTVKQDRARQDPDHPTRDFTIENRLPRILCTN